MLCHLSEAGVVLDKLVRSWPLFRVAIVPLCIITIFTTSYLGLLTRILVICFFNKYHSSCSVKIYPLATNHNTSPNVTQDELVILVLVYIHILGNYCDIKTYSNPVAALSLNS